MVKLHDPAPAFWSAPRTHGLRSAGLRHSEPQPPFRGLRGMLLWLRLALIWFAVLSGAYAVVWLARIVWSYLYG